MRGMRYGLFVVGVVSLLVAMTATGTVAARRLPVGGSSTLTAAVEVAPYDMMSPSLFADEDITFAYGNESASPAIIVNFSFPTGMGISTAELDAATTCDTTNAVVDFTLGGRTVAVSGISCAAGGGTLVLEVDGTSTLSAGTYDISSEFKVITSKRSRTTTNMWQVSGLGVIVVS